MKKRQEKRQGMRSETILIERSDIANEQRGAPAVLMAILVIAVGCLPLLIGLGVIKADRGVHAPLFVVGAIGVAFIMSGLMIISQALGLSQKSLLSKVMAFFLVSSFLAPFVWLSCLNNGPILFRLAFGVPVALFVLVCLARYIPGVKVLSSEEAAQRQIERISRKL